MNTQKNNEKKSKHYWGNFDFGIEIIKLLLSRFIGRDRCGNPGIQDVPFLCYLVSCRPIRG